ncbi:MAG: hypothetical protein M3075_14220 [Candidatus Dormibacteraeota bacterium]|jgi:hypothetical protein|nr:hypothetical protein [Candidatus Dormibacteraeota bacterium]
MTSFAGRPHDRQFSVGLVDDQLHPGGRALVSPVTPTLAEAVVTKRLREVGGEVSDLVVGQ